MGWAWPDQFLVALPGARVPEEHTCTEGCCVICRFFTRCAVLRPAEPRSHRLCSRIVSASLFLTSTIRLLRLAAQSTCTSHFRAASRADGRPEHAGCGGPHEIDVGVRFRRVMQVACCQIGDWTATAHCTRPRGKGAGRAARPPRP